MTRSITPTSDQYNRHVYIDDLPPCPIWPDPPESRPGLFGVTTFLSTFPKWLHDWNARVTAQFAWDFREQWAGLDEESAVALIAGERQRIMTRASRRGTELHSLLELVADGHDIPHDAARLYPAAAPYIDGLKAFLDECQPVFAWSEVAMFHQTLGYAGKNDAFCTLTGSTPEIRDLVGELACMDLKSRDNDNTYAENAAQIAAYARAEYGIIGDDDGSPLRRVKLPEVNLGFVLAVGTAGYSVMPFTDFDSSFEQFMRCKDLYDVKGRNPFGRPIVPGSDPIAHRRRERAAAETMAADRADHVGQVLDIAAKRVAAGPIRSAASMLDDMPDPVADPSPEPTCPGCGVAMAATEEACEACMAQGRDGVPPDEEPIETPYVVEAPVVEPVVKAETVSETTAAMVAQPSATYIEPEPDRDASTYVAEVTEWLKRRLRLMIQSYPVAATTIAEHWPDGVPPFKVKPVYDERQLWELEMLFNRTEAECKIPFGEAKPRTDVVVIQVAFPGSEVVDDDRDEARRAGALDAAAMVQQLPVDLMEAVSIAFADTGVSTRSRGDDFERALTIVRTASAKAADRVELIRSLVEPWPDADVRTALLNAASVPVDARLFTAKHIERLQALLHCVDQLWFSLLLENDTYRFEVTHTGVKALIEAHGGKKVAVLEAARKIVADNPEMDPVASATEVARRPHLTALLLVGAVNSSTTSAA